ncbi:hypothetical protein QTJ16_002105 [Diplocarpon rosae]|uniref:Adhesin domain-containing protein n=1 Tax=Diplocarpon rosae TaxID=946125 RepID=A0AAD9T594_9HELO|nr:hypothetical protein QTJ16_002105 [Diplocarpon rosae]
MSHPGANLYSADYDLGHEFWSNKLSPADGHFNPSGMASNSMLQDPTIGCDRKFKDKPLIPPPNTRRPGQSSGDTIHPLLARSPPVYSYATPHARPHTPLSPSPDTHISPVSPHRSEDMFSEQNHLLGGTPPAYSRIPTSPATLHEPIDRSYSFFPDYHLEAGLPSPREPGSMGAPVDEPTGRSPLAAGPLKTGSRQTVLKFAIAALVLALVTMLMNSTFHHDNYEDSIPNFPGYGNDKSPAKRPIDLVESYCDTAEIKEDEVIYEFPSGADFTVLQTTHGADDSRDLANVNTAGEVRIRRLPKDSEQGNRAYFTVGAYVSDPSLEILTTWDETSRFLEISTPRLARLDTGGSHCVSLQITAWLPEDAEFTNLMVQSATLNLRVVDDIKIKVTGQSKFASISGHVSFPSTSAEGFEMQSPGWRSSGPYYPFSSRGILVETMSGHIDGDYPLMDFLGLSSESGNVNVNVIPQEVLKEAPKPADLEVQTVSGSIQVNCPVGAGDPAYQPPPRNYITNVHSSTGSIRGSFYLGSSSDFKSISSTITIIGLPVLQDDSSSGVSAAPNNTLATHTISGTTNVQILEPIFIAPANSVENPAQSSTDSNTPYLVLPTANTKIQSLFVIDPRTATTNLKLRSLKSTHASKSALINVNYPDAWEGTMRARTVSGKIQTFGEGTRIIRERKGIANQELVLGKGVGAEGEGCLVEMQDIAGSLYFTAGGPQS